MTPKDKKILIKDKLTDNKIIGKLFGSQLEAFRTILEEYDYHLRRQDYPNIYYNDIKKTQIIIYPQHGIADLFDPDEMTVTLVTIQGFKKYHDTE